QSAPIIAEVVAVQRAVAIAEATRAPIYILHTSSGRALRVAEDAIRRGLSVYVETRPMYLHLTQDVYQRPDAGLYLGGPPLREKWDQDMLLPELRPLESSSRNEFSGTRFPNDFAVIVNDPTRRDRLR